MLESRHPGPAFGKSTLATRVVSRRRTAVLAGSDGCRTSPWVLGPTSDRVPGGLSGEFLQHNVGTGCPHLGLSLSRPPLR